MHIYTRFRGFRGFWEVRPAAGQGHEGLVWAHDRGTRPELLADPGLPSHPPVLPSCHLLSVWTSLLVLDHEV
jgi:hypothetical protein